MTVDKSAVMADLRHVMDLVASVAQEYEEADVPTETRESVEWLRVLRYARTKLSGVIDLLDRKEK